MKLNYKTENAFILAAIAAFCGGSTPVISKIALQVFSPFTVISLRFLFACLFLLPLIYKQKALSWKLFKGNLGVAILGALNPILLILALPLTQASVSPLIYACVPALTAIYLYAINHQKISRKQVVGIVMGLTGVALVILLPIIQRGSNLSALAGNLVIFVAAIVFMFYGIRSKKHHSQLQTSPLILTFYFCVVSLIISLPFTIRDVVMTNVNQTPNLLHILSVVFIGVVGTGIFYVIYQRALKLSTEVTAALFTYLQPITTISLAALLLGERITWAFVVGGILAVLGARLASQK